MTAQTSATPGQGIAKPVASTRSSASPSRGSTSRTRSSGKYTYIQNVDHPGDAACAERPPARRRRATRRRTTSRSAIDENSIKHIPGAEVVRIGNFLAVVAPKEYDAIQAAAQLKVTWKSDPKLPGSGNFWGWLRQAGDTNTANPPRYTTGGTTADGVNQGLAGAAKTVSATYMYQYNSFMPIGPHARSPTCDAIENSATVWLAQQALIGLPTTSRASSASRRPTPRDLRTRARARSAAVSRPRSTSRPRSSRST